MPNGTLVFPRGQEQPWPVPSPQKIRQQVYKRNAILCFPAGHILPQAPDTAEGWAQKTWGGAVFSIFPFFLKKKKKRTDENELTAKKMNTKTLKTVMIADKKSWEGRKGARGHRARGGVSLPAVHQRPTLPSKKGCPRRAQRPGQRGKAQEHGGWGHKHPPLKPRGRGKRGIIKAKKLQN